MRIVSISDTHNLNKARGQHIPVPDGDVLIHCGDATMGGSRAETRDFANWLRQLPHKHKIFVPGNHDWLFEDDLTAARDIMQENMYNLHILIDSGVEIDRIKFWGTPIQPFFHNWAFNEDNPIERKRHYDLIPEGTQVLVTHSPPYGVLDQVPSGEHVGCTEMRAAVARVRPSLHVFGHIHCSYGQACEDGTVFANCAMANEAYWIRNPAFVYDV